MDKLRNLPNADKDIRKGRNLSFSDDEWAVLQGRAAEESARMGRPVGVSEYIRQALGLQPLGATG